MSRERNRVVGRAGVVVPGALLLAAGLAGCVSFPAGVCPAVGYVSHVGIIVDGAAADAVAGLEVCTDRGCVTSATDAPLPTAAPISTLSAAGEGRWRAELDLDLPDALTVEAFDAAGASLGTTEADLEWRRVGGSVSCPGPHETDPVVITVD